MNGLVVPPAEADPRGSPAGEPPLPPTGRAVLRIVGLWRRRASGLGVGALLAILSVLAGVLLLALAGGTTVSGARSLVRIGGVVVVAGVALRVLGVGRLVLRYAERLAAHDAMFRALADLRVWFFRRIAAGAASGIGFRRSGDLLSRLVGDVEALDALYLRILVPLAGAVAVLPLLVFVLARRDLALGLTVGALFVGCALVVPAVAGYAASRGGEAMPAGASSLRVAVLDMVAGLREVRAFGAEDRMLAAAQGREAGLIAAQLAAQRRAAFADALGFLFAQAALLAVLAAVATGLGSGAGAAGFALVAVFVVIAAFESTAGLPRAGVLAGQAAAAARRVVGAAGAGADVVTAASVAAPIGGDRTIRFEDVHFGWEPGRAVLDGVSLSIPPGGRVAILGPSGAGKSTLASLALGLSRPSAGRVTLGGTDAADIAPDALRRTIGLLNQRTHLFADTIRGNLLIGAPDAADDALWRALDAASLGAWVRTLPDGLDTWLGEGGATVSGGQGRRIALARALLAPTPILILDEPATGLDSEAEREFLEALNQGAGDRTVVMIAHRLTGVERLDRIWRLSGGRAAAAAA